MSTFRHFKAMEGQSSLGMVNSLDPKRLIPTEERSRKMKDFKQPLVCNAHSVRALYNLGSTVGLWDILTQNFERYGTSGNMGYWEIWDIEGSIGIGTSSLGII